MVSKTTPAKQIAKKAMTKKVAMKAKSAAMKAKPVMKAKRVTTIAAMKKMQVAMKRKGEVAVECRMANNGKWYTFPDFEKYYGGIAQERWDQAMNKKVAMKAKPAATKAKPVVRAMVVAMKKKATKK
mmetsp:Transcript_136048/g.435177  ORF Transcript_136048/g.435177 Transcript_136048/m.435177 type:complete len:127 (+) Transcript_136048:135-515(+)